MEKISRLHDILIERLPHIKRWKKVSVGTWDKSPQWVKDVYPENSDNIYICWNGKKSQHNTHDYEIKEIPLKDIDNLITRNLERLRNERSVYK
jgi:hypothetical protein